MENTVTLNFKRMSFAVRRDKIKSISNTSQQHQMILCRLADSCAQLLCNTKWENDILLTINPIYKGFEFIISSEATMARYQKYNSYFTAYAKNHEANIFQKSWTNASIAHIESILKKTKTANVSYQAIAKSKILLELHFTVSYSKLVVKDIIDDVLNPSNKTQKLRYNIDYGEFQKLLTEDIINGINQSLTNPIHALQLFRNTQSIFAHLIAICIQFQLNPLDPTIQDTINNTILLSSNQPNDIFYYWLQDLATLTCENKQLQDDKKIGYIILTIKDNLIKYIHNNSAQNRYENGKYIETLSLFTFDLISFEIKHQKKLLDTLIVNIALHQQTQISDKAQNPIFFLYDKYFCEKYNPFVRNYLTLLIATHNEDFLVSVLFIPDTKKFLIHQQIGVYQAFLMLQESPTLSEGTYGLTAWMQEVISWKRKLPIMININHN